jgi:hypothetical protein
MIAEGGKQRDKEKDERIKVKIGGRRRGNGS